MEANGGYGGGLYPQQQQQQQRHMTSVKASATDAVLSGGARRRHDQSRQLRTRNRDYYINSRRERGGGGGVESIDGGVAEHAGTLRRGNSCVGGAAVGSAALPTSSGGANTNNSSTLWTMAGVPVVGGDDSDGLLGRSPNGGSMRLGPSAPTPGGPFMSRMGTDVLGGSGGESDESPARRPPAPVPLTLNAHLSYGSGFSPPSAAVNVGVSAYYHNTNTSPTLGPDGGGALGCSSDGSPMALSLRFLSRFRLSGSSASLRGGGGGGCGGADCGSFYNDLGALLALEAEAGGAGLLSSDGTDAPAAGEEPLCLPRLHSQAAIGAMRRTAERRAAGRAEDSCYSATMPSLGHNSDAHTRRGGHGPTASNNRCTAASAFGRSVALNLQALEGCLDAVADAVAEGHRRLVGLGGVGMMGGSLGSAAAAAAAASAGQGRAEEAAADGSSSGEPIGLLVEDLNTTLQSLFEAERAHRQWLRAGAREAAAAAAAASASAVGSGEGRAAAAAEAADHHARVAAAVAVLFSRFITAEDAYESIYWQIVAAAASLLRSDTAAASVTPFGTDGSGGVSSSSFVCNPQPSADEVAALLVGVGQWVGLTTVTCLHALGLGGGGAPAVTFSTSANAQEAVRSSITGLFTLLLHFAVGDFSPIARLWAATGTGRAPLLSTQQQQHHQQPSYSNPSPTSSAYCRQLQELCAEACAMLLSSSQFSQFVGLTETIPIGGEAVDGDDDASSPTSMRAAPLQRADTDALTNDALVIESLLLRPFALCADGFAPSTAVNGSAVANASCQPAVAMSLAEGFLLRDAQENAALLLCIVCAAVGSLNAGLIDHLEKYNLFFSNASEDGGASPLTPLAALCGPAPTSFVVVAPRVASLAFAVFSQFLSQAVSDVSRAVAVSAQLQQGRAAAQQQQQAASVSTTAAVVGGSSSLSSVLSPSSSVLPSTASLPQYGVGVGVGGGGGTAANGGSAACDSAYYDPYTGCQYYPSATSTPTPPPAAASLSSPPYPFDSPLGFQPQQQQQAAGAFEVEGRASLDSVMNALKGLGDLIAVSAAAELLKVRGLLPQLTAEQQQRAPHAFPFSIAALAAASSSSGSAAVAPSFGISSSTRPLPFFDQPSSHHSFGAVVEKRRTPTVADGEFAAASERLDRLSAHRAASAAFGGCGGSTSAVVVAFYAQLRVEVGARLMAPIVGAVANPTNAVGGWDHFRPLLQNVPPPARPLRQTVTGNTTAAASSASASAAHSSLLLLPLIGADDPLATAFMLAEGVVCFYSADAQLAASIPADVMHYLYSHNDILFRVAETFSPTDTAVCSFSSLANVVSAANAAGNSGVAGSGVGDVGVGGGFVPIGQQNQQLQQRQLSPPSALDPLFHQHQQQHRPHHQHITPLLLRCRDALSALYCRAPSLVFTHWDLFSASILPFLSNQIDSFSRRHVLFILASLFKDARYKEQVMLLAERPEFQNALGAVMFGEGELEEAAMSPQQQQQRALFAGDDEDDDEAGVAGVVQQPSQHHSPAAVATTMPFSAEESELLDVIVTAVMGGSAGLANQLGMGFGSSDDDAGGYGGGGGMGDYVLY